MMIRGISNALVAMVPQAKEIVLHAGHLDRMQALLRRAIQENNLPLAKYAMEHGAPINRQDQKANDGNNDYHIVRAAYYRTNAIAKELIDHGAAVNVACQHGHTPLIASATMGRNRKLIPELLKANADVHRKDHEGRTALMEAAASKDLSAVNMLLKAGAKCEMQDKAGKTALFSPLEFGKFFFSYAPYKMSLLIEKLSDPESMNLPDASGTTPLMLAISNGLAPIVSQLLQKGADRFAVNVSGEETIGIAYKERERLKNAIENFDQIISILEPVEGVQEEYQGEDVGYTKLSAAVHFNQIEKVSECLAKGADVHQVSYRKLPLTHAAELGHLEIVKRLLGSGANPKFVYRGVTALGGAIEKRSWKQDDLVEMVKIIDNLEKGNA